MSEIIHLENAPIREAVFDIQVTDAVQISDSTYSDIQDAVSQLYPHAEDLLELNVSGGNHVPHSMTAKKKGIRLQDSNKQSMVQFRRDGFTFNKLRPYSDWDSCIKITQDMWQIYCEHVNPPSVKRIATRFINFIDVPMPADLSEYLTTMPQLPDVFEGTITSFLSRISYYDEESGNFAHINLSSKDGNGDEIGTIILDIDAYIFEEFQCGSEDIWQKFTELRDLKNKMFFNFLTQQTILKYQ